MRADPPKMGILDDTNPFRGAGIDGAKIHERVRSARRMAVVSVVMSVLWGAGVLSFAGLAIGGGAWAFLRTNDERAAYRNVALVGFVLGLVGLIATVIAFGPDVVQGDPTAP